ncbi:MAG TPA: hypothetical protein VED66_09190 [Candidatus Sulfotelmatobacter sp.]|nr:hypothetical protein [Candidatus Sulfotelmatobacter sp.]
MKRSHVLLFIGFCLVTIGNRSALAQIPADLPREITELQEPASAAEQTPAQDPPAPPGTVDHTKPGADGKGSAPDSPQPKIQPDASQEAQQTTRILWVIPNYRSVSANTYLPPQSFKEKFWLATQDSFDYSAFIWNGMVAGIAMAGKSEPSFGQGASGYSIYYAHAFADGTIENYLVEAIVPNLTKEDPRYYTLGHGGFVKRSGYALSRLLITRKDSGRDTFNFSEVVGAGAAAGIGNAYYPSSQNQWVKTYQRWGSQLIQDAIGNVAKEFWPDINRAVFHNKY